MPYSTILHHPHPLLRQKALPVSAEEISQPAFQRFLEQLAQTMIHYQGIGLAAPQVSRLIQVIAVNAAPTPLILINPKIIKKSWRTTTEEEGCLSLPNVFGFIKRNKKIKVRALNREGQPVEFQAADLLSRVIQHEIDHLDGILFIDKAKKISTK